MYLYSSLTVSEGEGDMGTESRVIFLPEFFGVNLSLRNLQSLISCNGFSWIPKRHCRVKLGGSRRIHARAFVFTFCGAMEEKMMELAIASCVVQPLVSLSILPNEWSK